MTVSQYAEVVVVLYSAVLGLCFVSACGVEERFRLALVLPVGYSLIVVSSLLSLLFFSVFRSDVALGVPLIVVLMLIFFNRGPALGRIFQFNSHIFLSIVILAAAIFCYLRTVILTWDSYMMIGLGWALADGRHLQEMGGLFSVFPFYSMPTHAMNRLLGNDYSCTYSPMGVVGALSGVIFYVRIILEKQSYSALLTRFSALSTLAIIFSSYYLMHQAIYVNNHTWAACLIVTLALLIFQRGNEPFSNGGAGCLFVLLAGLAFVRVEGLALVSIFFVILLERRLLNRSQLTIGIVSLSCLYFGWFALVLHYKDALYTHATPKRAAVMAVPIVLMTIGYLLGPLSRYRALLREIAGFVMLVSLVLYALSDSNHFAESVTNTVINMLVAAPWGVIWPATFVSLATAIRKRNENNHDIVYFILAYLALILLFSSLRGPYRIAWKDSGNRILLHIVPLIAILLFTEIARGLASLQKRGNRLH